MYSFNTVEEALEKMPVVAECLNEKGLMLLIADWMIKHNTGEIGGSIKLNTGTVNINAKFEPY